MFTDVKSEGLWVNAYFDTSNGQLACTDVSNNCDNLVKFKDDSVWNFLQDMQVKFENKNR